MQRETQLNIFESFASKQHLRPLRIMPVFALLLAGCGGTPVAITEMSAALSAELAAEAEGAATPVDVSRGFKAAVAQAVSTNSGYKAALASEREATSNIGVAESVRKPQLGANANLGTIREFGSNGSTSSGIAGGVSLSQLVYDGGESVAAINRATAEALGAQAERAARANELALDVARAWIDVWQHAERLRLLRTRTDEMDTLVGQIERMATTGMLDRAALDSARRQIVDIQLEESRLQSDLADAQVRFQRYFRQAPGRLGRPVELVDAGRARAQARDWRGAPSLEARAASVFAARHAVKEAESAFRPRLRLQTGLRTPLESGDPTSGNFGLGFDYALLDGGRRVHQLEVAIARASALEGALREEQTALEAELEAALTRLEGIDRSVPLVAQKLSLSQSEAETARSQLATGQSTLRQLVEAEIETYRAEDQQIALQAERLTLLLTIAARTGALGKIIGLEE